MSLHSLQAQEAGLEPLKNEAICLPKYAPLFEAEGPGWVLVHLKSIYVASAM